MSKKEEKEFRGNVYLRNAKIYAGNDISFSEIQLAGIQAFATLALAEEQQTANMLTYLSMMPLPPEAKEVEIEIRKRLGFPE